MSQSITRVLAVLELLQTHGRLSGAEMSRRLEVDGRTLRRYIIALEELGMPILSERGRHGGYALMPGFKLPPMMFGEDETMALAIGLLAVRGLGLPETAAAVASAAAKLERVMPAAIKQRMREFGDAVNLDLARASAPVDSAVLHVLASAVAARRSVQVRYRSGQGVDSERRIDPYGVAFHAGGWYVVGMCALRHGIRTFRLDRIGRIEAGDTVFTRPASFDTLAHLREAVAGIAREFSVRVLLRTDLASARRYVGDAIGVLEQVDAGVLLHNQSDDLEWFARILAALPFEFQIEQPERLRDEVSKVARRLLVASA